MQLIIGAHYDGWSVFNENGVAVTRVFPNLKKASLAMDELHNVCPETQLIFAMFAIEETAFRLARLSGNDMIKCTSKTARYARAAALWAIKQLVPDVPNARMQEYIGAKSRSKVGRFLKLAEDTQVGNAEYTRLCYLTVISHCKSVPA